MTAANEVPTVIVGGGPAGLAVGACLKQANAPFVILEAAESVGTSWRNHYVRLHLHTVKRHSGLPGLPFPKEAPKYVPREEVVRYLEAYASYFALPLRFRERVTSITREGDVWVTRSSNGTWHSKAVVVTTGYNAVPVRPTWPGEAKFKGRLLHSAEYRTGATFKGQKVLVVGLGNTGGEIALDLVEQGALASISVRSPVHVVPRDFLGLPVQQTGILIDPLPLSFQDRMGRLVSRLAMGNLTRLGLRTPVEGPISQVVTRGRIPMIDVGTIAMIRAGKIGIEPDIAEFTATGVRFAGDIEKPFDAVVLATGYRPGLELFLADHAKATDGRGYPKGISAGPELPGLYFVGYRNVPTGLLRNIGIEARQVSAAIAAA